MVSRWPGYVSRWLENLSRWPGILFRLPIMVSWWLEITFLVVVGAAVNAPRGGVTVSGSGVTVSGNGFYVANFRISRKKIALTMQNSFDCVFVLSIPFGNSDLIVLL